MKVLPETPQRNYIWYLPFYSFCYTSVDTEMCCPKGKGECQYFIFLTLKKKKFMDTGSWIFFNKKLILDYSFCLKSGPVFYFKFSSFFLFKSMNNIIPESNKWINITDFFYMHLFTMQCQCVLNRSSNQDAHYSCPR